MSDAERTDERTPTILVVDDDFDAVNILTRLLRKKGYRTVEARSGKEALRRAEEEDVDLILLDVMMPDMDGLQVAARLADDEATRPIPIILLTALSDTKTKLTGMKLGVSDFLTKPVRRNDLYARVHEHLEARNMGRKMDEAISKVPKGGGGE